eukprot:1148767-Pelagomonas_calceolata.AAC.2
MHRLALYTAPHRAARSLHPALPPAAHSLRPWLGSPQWPQCLETSSPAPPPAQTPAAKQVQQVLNCPNVWRHLHHLRLQHGRLRQNKPSRFSIAPMSGGIFTSSASSTDACSTQGHTTKARVVTDA